VAGVWFGNGDATRHYDKVPRTAILSDPLC
jgi:hypothetical protein